MTNLAVRTDGYGATDSTAPFQAMQNDRVITVRDVGAQAIARSNLAQGAGPVAEARRRSIGLGCGAVGGLVLLAIFIWYLGCNVAPSENFSPLCFNRFSK